MERAEPPKEIPPDLIDKYSMNGKIAVKYLYFNDSYPPEKPIVYEKETVDSYLERIKGNVEFYYGKTDQFLYRALEKFKIKGKDVAIMGSVAPLYESICLFYGGKPTTIEYNKIISRDSRIRTMTVEEYDKNPLKFDAAFSISSFEHDGLGRYGDALNPDGDLNAMRKMKSILKPNGLLFLSVPVGEDVLVWNAHRYYGKIRLPLLLKGWKLLDVFSTSKISQLIDEQPIFVLENSDLASCEYEYLFKITFWDLVLSKMKANIYKTKNILKHRIN